MPGLSGFLLVPPQKDRTVATLRRKVRLIALRTLLLARPSDASLGRSLAVVQRWLPGAAKKHRQGVLDAIGAPDVLPLLLCHAAGLGDEAMLLDQGVPQLLVELSQRGLVDEALLWERTVDHLVLREGLAPVDARALLVDPAGIEVDTPGGKTVPSAAQAPVSLAAPNLQLTLWDANPLAMSEAHPEKEGNAIDLGGHDLDAWTAALNEALKVVQTALPTWFDELRFSLDRLVPVGYHDERHFSASYREAPGLAYLTLHPDPLTLAEAIVHETQHGKANLLSWIDPILRNAHTEWAQSPVRPDLRPLWGILLAIHAFVPVSVLHMRLAELDHPLSHTARFATRRHEVLSGNARGLTAVLDKADPTDAGRRLLDDLATLHAATMQSAGERPLDPEALPPG